MAQERLYTIRVEGGNNAEKEIGQLIKKIDELSATLGLMRNSLVADEGAMGKVAVQIKALTERKRELLKTTTDLTKATQFEEGSLLQLRAELAKDTKAYDAMGKAARDSVAGKTLESSIHAQVAALNKLEQATGRFQRQVGNYNVSGVAMSQVLREIPAFTYSAQTGILALSNNLPILADSFRQVANSIDNVTGKKVGFIGALKDMGKNIFSLGGIATVALGLFTIFSDKIFDAISGVKTLSEEEKNFNEIMAHSETVILDSADALAVLRGEMTDTDAEVKQLEREYQVKIDEILEGTKKKVKDASGTMNYLWKAIFTSPLDYVLGNTASKRIADEQKGIIQKDADAVLALYNERDARIRVLEEREAKRAADAAKRAAEKRAKEAEKRAKEAADKDKERNKNHLALEHEYYEQQAKNIQDETGRQLALESEAWSYRLQTLNSFYTDGLHKKEDVDRLIEAEERGHQLKVNKIINDALAEKRKIEDEEHKRQIEADADAKHDKLAMAMAGVDLYEKVKIKQAEQDEEEKRKQAEQDEEEKKRRKAIAQELYQFEQKAQQKIFDMKNAAIDRQLKREETAIQKAADSQEQIIKNKLDKGMITESQYQEQKAALDAETLKKTNEAQRKAFEEHKRIAKLEAAINMASAVMQIAASPANKIDPTGTLMALQIAGVLALGAMEIAAIDAQKFATGGKVKRANMAAQSNGDNVLSTLTVGEVVLNKRQQEMLGGDATFAAIGVPGVTSSTYTPNQGLYSSTSSGSISKKDMAAMLLAQAKVINDKKVYNVEADSRRISNQVTRYESERTW